MFCWRTDRFILRFGACLLLTTHNYSFNEREVTKVTTTLKTANTLNQLLQPTILFAPARNTMMKQEDLKDSKPVGGNEISSNSDVHMTKSKQMSEEQLRDLSLLLQKQQYEMMIKESLLDKKASTKESYPKVEPPITSDRLQHEVVFGKVRGTPYGSCVENDTTESESKEEVTERTDQWKQWRKKNFDPIQFPVEGFEHMYGRKDIDEQENYGAEAAALATQLGSDAAPDVDPEAGREYGSIRTPLDAPIGALKDKWRVLPHFLNCRSLMRQHIDSFDYFVNIEMKEIVQSPSACEIRSEHDPKFYLRYTDCWVGEPSVEEDSYATTQATPFQCRLRDCTYSAPIYVNIRYTRGRQIVVKKKVSLW